MHQLESTTELLEHLEKLILLFRGGDPNPFSNRQEKQLDEWKLLLKGDSKKRSKTREFVRSLSRKIAFKVRDLAGIETLMLWMLRYSITASSNVTYYGLYPMLQEWSSKTSFPDMLKEHALKFWNEPSTEQSRALYQPPQYKPVESLEKEVGVEIRNETPANVAKQVILDDRYQVPDSMNDSMQSFIALEAGDVPGLQLCILQNQLPQSVYELNIGQLISWIQRFQSNSSSPFQITKIIECLQTYRLSCPTLRYLQLIFPWYGAMPYIDIKINSAVGCSAKVQLSEMLAADLRQYIHDSWTTTETANGNIA